MKKKCGWFLGSLVFFILSTLAIIGLPLNKWPWEPGQPFVAIIFAWLVQLISLIVLVVQIKNFFIKRNYRWDKLEEESYFTIVWLSEQFKAAMPDFTADSCEILIMIPGIGNVLVSFPTHSGAWGYEEPKEGEKWKRVGDKFIREVTTYRM